jgi:hypothetical protein
MLRMLFLNVAYFSSCYMQHDSMLRNFSSCCKQHVSMCNVIFFIEINLTATVPISMLPLMLDVATINFRCCRC